MKRQCIIFFLVLSAFVQTSAQNPTFWGQNTTVTPPADFATDSFTEASDVVLSAHTGELGATWTKHASYAQTVTVDAATDRIYADGTVAYYASGTPPSPNYYVQNDVYAASIISTNAGPYGRIDTATDSMYGCRMNNGTDWQLRVINSGSATTLGTSANQLPTAGQTKTLRLTMSGSTITCSVNGVVEISVTDGSITAAGKAGVRFAGAGTATTGFLLDAFSAR